MKEFPIKMMILSFSQVIAPNKINIKMNENFEYAKLN